MDRIDLGRAFKAPFEDKEWVVKTLLGFLWGLLVVTIPAVIGAELEYIRRVSRGDETLPDWGDFGKKWVEGFLVAVAGFIYFLPVWVLGLVLLVPAVIGAATSGDSSGMFGAMLGGGLCLFWTVAFVYGVFIWIFVQAAITNFAMKGDFGSLFAFSEIRDRIRTGNYFTAWFYTLVLAVLSSIVSGALSGTGVGGILAPAISYLVFMMTGHLLGQWARVSYAVVPIAPTTPPSGPPAPTYTPPPPPPAAPMSAAPPAPAAPAPQPPAPAAPAPQPPAPAPAPEPPAPEAPAPPPAPDAGTGSDDQAEK